MSSEALAVCTAAALVAGALAGCATRRVDRCVQRRPERHVASRSIGVDYPRSDTDFWNSYIKYVPQFAQRARRRR